MKIDSINNINQLNVNKTNKNISNNNCYAVTFNANTKFNKQQYEQLKLLRKQMTSWFIADKYDFEKHSNVILKFITYFIKYPQEARSLKPCKEYIKDYASEILRDSGSFLQKLKLIYRLIKNQRKFIKECKARESKIGEFISQAIKENNITPEESNNIMSELSYFFGVKQAT